MQKKYIVRLTEEERQLCQEAIDKLSGRSQKARRARILLQVDVDGPGWPDRQVAEAYRCRTNTVENIRKRCVLEGFEVALNGRQRDPSSYPPKRLDGQQEARVIALRLGPPPAGHAQWSLRLLANQVVELGICETISHETVHRTLKRRFYQPEAAVLGDSARGECGVCGGDGAGAADL